MARSRKKRLKKKVLFTLILILVIGIGAYFGIKQIFNNDIQNNNTNNNGSNVSKEEPQDEVYELSMIATGDALIHNAVFFSYEQGYRGSGIYNFDGALDYVRDI